MLFINFLSFLAGLLSFACLVGSRVLPAQAAHPLPNLDEYSPMTGVLYRGPVKGITHRVAKARTGPSPIEEAAVLQTMRTVRGRLNGHSAASAVGCALGRVLGAAFQNVTSVTTTSTQYAVSVLWDSKPIWLLLDTGSSDTWAVPSGFHCVDATGNEYPQAACAEGPNFVNGFAHGPLPNIHFGLRFGSGEYVSGPMGLSDISVGGLVVEQLQVGLANVTYWQGNNITNGILGLAFESLTSGYFGPPGDDQFLETYPPFFAEMIAQGLIKHPYFSIAIDRKASTGLVGWGGMPPADWYNPEGAETDIIITTINQNRPNSGWEYSYYTIVVDGLQWDLTTNSQRFLYIVDTGSTLLYLPPPMADAVAAAYSPPAVFLWEYGSYFAPCNALAPMLIFKIGGVDIPINPRDLIYPDMQDPLTGYCQIAVANGGTGPYILGDVFLQSVVAVYDVGAAKMRFHSRL